MNVRDLSLYLAKNHRAIFCEVGNQWWHIQCANVTPQEYKDLEQNSDPWICNLCNNFNFSESFFDTSLDLSHSLQYFIGPGFKDISPLHSIMIMKSLWCLQFSSIGIDKGLNLPCFR
jgi:hypothetical protein